MQSIFLEVTMIITIIQRYFSSQAMRVVAKGHLFNTQSKSYRYLNHKPIISISSLYHYY